MTAVSKSEQRLQTGNTRQQQLAIPFLGIYSWETVTAMLRVSSWEVYCSGAHSNEKKSKPFHYLTMECRRAQNN